MAQVRRVADGYASTLSRMLNKAGIRARVCGDGMQVWISTSSSEGAKVREFLNRNGFQFTASAQMY